MVFVAALLGVEFKRDDTENKLASLLVVSLDKKLNMMSPSLCSSQVAAPSSVFVMVVHSN